MDAYNLYFGRTRCHSYSVQKLMTICLQFWMDHFRIFLTLASIHQLNLTILFLDAIHKVEGCNDSFKCLLGRFCGRMANSSSPFSEWMTDTCSSRSETGESGNWSRKWSRHSFRHDNRGSLSCPSFEIEGLVAFAKKRKPGYTGEWMCCAVRFWYFSGRCILYSCKRSLVFEVCMMEVATSYWRLYTS